MADYELLSVADTALWHKYLSLLPSDQQDVHFTPEYLKLYEDKGDGVAKCFVFKDDNDLALYPFLLKSINSLGYNLNGEYYDIQGVYGYNGIALTTSSVEFQRKYVDAFENFVADTNILSEMIRINPILNPLFKYSDYYETTKRNTLYYTNLQVDNIQYDEYEHSSRKNIKKAKRMGVDIRSSAEVVAKEILNSFCEIYYDTMDRNKAESIYYFPHKFFSEAIKCMVNSTKIYIAYVDQYPVSAELVLYDKIKAYSFLGGTKAEYFAYRPNDLLKHAIIEDMRAKGLKYFVLGGGYTEGDGISKYKKSFAKNNNIGYYHGNRIHNEAMYLEMMGQWKEKYPEVADKFKNAFQGYRITQ